MQIADVYPFKAKVLSASKIVVATSNNKDDFFMFVIHKPLSIFTNCAV